MSHFLENFPISQGTHVIELTANGPTHYNTDEIEQRINQITAGLISLGLPTNSPIAILDFCTFNYMSTTVGIYRSRHSLIAINHKLPAERIEYCFNDSQPVLTFCSSRLRHLVPHNMKCIEFESPEFDALLLNNNVVLPKLNPEYVNNIMYTSGTTGNPKGVVTTYSARMWQQAKTSAIKLPQIHEKSISICASPLYHLAGLNNVEHDLFSSQFKDTLIVLMPLFNARDYLEAIEKYKVTHIRLISPMMSMILQESDLVSKLDLTSVEHVSLTSSAAPKKLQDDVKRYFPNVTEILNPYGLTETGPLFGAHPKNIPKPATSVGYPVPGVNVRLDENGVLQIKSPAMLSKYHKKDSAPSFTDDGYFITGDIFRVNKYGFYFYVGRADDMFKSGGEKIYPSEIESVIDSHPLVAISTVVGVPDDIKGHKPYAFVQLQPGVTATPNDIKEFTIKNVATYQIPREVWIVESMPKTNIGKIDRRRLTEMAAQLLNKNDL